MQRYKITLEYDGTGLAGWQRQAEIPSVQQLLEEAVYKFSQVKQEIIAAGRTDAGVHARGQVAHIDLDKEYNNYSIMQGINFYLLETRISVIKAEPVDESFHARFSAKKRYYTYHIVNRQANLALDADRAWHVPRPLDLDNMRKAAGYLIGHHDFTTFRSSVCQAKSPLKTLDDIKIEQNGENIYLHFTAQSYLHHMVRNIVATLKMVGEGKWQPQDVKKALETKDRTAGGPTAAAGGLYFMKVDY